MPDSNARPPREDALYAATFAFVARHAVEIALVGPFLLVMVLLPDAGGVGVLLVVLIYLGEAIVYAGRRRRQGVRPLDDPRASLHAGARWVWRLAGIGAAAVVLVVLSAIATRIGL